MTLKLFFKARRAMFWPTVVDKWFWTCLLPTRTPNAFLWVDRHHCSTIIKRLQRRCFIWTACRVISFLFSKFYRVMSWESFISSVYPQTLLCERFSYVFFLVLLRLDCFQQYVFWPMTPLFRTLWRPIFIKSLRVWRNLVKSWQSFRGTSLPVMKSWTWMSL